ncbi:hypothetical protein SARC_07584 [Sphaeroforma arctica JP610]|uniref:Elongation of fatty acids protein n=1 Tax=Sphaeroforma arctica JP610 TaxID=667725 RepID=A0A0L0FVS2_9EUKA|nr:hypothetical protein SARC_07584 [Sphaeroforma arctica JP610]KNC80038.1 hypothetical protein SARC_07584 [Sphaeroforma arctica JP610]|eukprot:XP_014153940.1 hypothetical protein SARC_07584 [Sphaeroforma arctica JP610]
MAQIQNITRSFADFQGEDGDYTNAPLMSFQALIVMAIVYLVLRFGLEKYMVDKKPVDTQFPAMVSNALLAVGSAWMFWGFASQLYENWSAENWDLNLLVCDPDLKLQNSMDKFIYVFYLSKFWEYIDTLFLILGKKQVIGLHWFHHLITPSICWVAYQYPGACAWMGPLSNAFVHVCMYTYYTLTYFSMPRTFGKYITQIQITQFLGNVMLFTVIFANLLFGQGHQQCGGSWLFYIYVMANYVNFLFMFKSFNTARLAKLNKKKRAAQLERESKAAFAEAALDEQKKSR